MAPTKPPSNAKAASAGHTSARGYRRQPGEHQPGPPAPGDVREGFGAFDDNTDAGEPPIGAREDDFSARSWWLVDVDGDGGGSTQGATALVKRCMRAYGWDLPKTRQILASYRQFLELKATLEDWDATLLSPCHLVDQMWHQHILDNFNYYHDTVLLYGHFLGHNPDGALDVSAKLKRDRFTRESLRQHFGDSYDEEIWDIVGEDRGRAGNNGDPEVISPGTAVSTKRDSISICLKDQAGETIMYRIKRTQQMSVAFNAFARRKGVVVGDLRFLFYGDEVEPDSTPRDLALGNQAVIDVILCQSGCGHQPRGDEPITIRLKDHNGEETMFKIKRSTRMAKVKHAYAARKGVEAASLRLYLDGETIGSDETPAILGLEDEDRIDVMPGQCAC